MKKKRNFIRGILLGISLILVGIANFLMYRNTQEIADSGTGIALGLHSLLVIMYRYLGRVGTLLFWIIIGGIAIYKDGFFKKNKSE